MYQVQLIIVHERSSNNEHCSTRGIILNNEMSAFSDSEFTSNSARNSLVEPPVTKLRYVEPMVFRDRGKRTEFAESVF